MRVLAGCLHISLDASTLQTLRIANGNAVFKKPASSIGLVSKILHRLHFQLDQSPWSYGLSVAYIAPPTRRSPLHHKAARTNESSRFLSACSGASDALTMFGGPPGKHSPVSPTTLTACALACELGWRCAQHVTAVASPWDVACVLDVVQD